MENSNALSVEFYEDALEVPFESEQAGRPVYRQAEFVRIVIRGDLTNVIETTVSETHKRDFPQQYERFKKGLTAAVEGTPLNMWPPLTKSQVKDLNYFEIQSVEQLADVSDAVCAKIGMGAIELRGKARAWLLASQNAEVVVKQAAENDQLRNEIEMLKEQMGQLTAPKRGRPAKDLEQPTAPESLA